MPEISGPPPALKMNLNLDNPEWLWRILENQNDISAVLELCRANVHLVSSISACGNLPDSLENALKAFVDSAKGRVTSVSAYHGCRVVSEPPYRDRGIRKLETANIVSWCKDFFGEDNRIDEIIRGLKPGYIGWGESAVFCMRGIQAAKKNNCAHSKGSELVRNIASRLGKEAETKYFSEGRECFIEVCAPSEWFTINSRTKIECLLKNVFVHWLWVRLELGWPGDPREGAIIFEANVPPGFIRKFHYLT